MLRLSNRGRYAVRAVFDLAQNEGAPVVALAGTVVAEAIDVPGIDTAESAVQASCAEMALEAARTILDM